MTPTPSPMDPTDTWTREDLGDGRYRWRCSLCGFNDVIPFERLTHPCPGPIGGAPGLLRQVGNFVVAGAQHIAAGRPKATDAQVNERLAICKACPSFKSLTETSGQCTEISCGCYLYAADVEDPSWPNKLRWADQACPIGKWQAIPPAE